MLWKHKVKKISDELRSSTGTHDWNWEGCSNNDRLITMDPPEQLRLPMFIVGSEFDVFVATQADNFRSATPSSSLLGIGSLQYVAHSFRSIVHREGIASSASTRPQVVSSVGRLRQDPPLIWVLVIFDFFAQWYRRGRGASFVKIL